MRPQASTAPSAPTILSSSSSATASIALELLTESELTRTVALPPLLVERPFRHPDQTPTSLPVIEVDGFVAAGGMGRVFKALLRYPGQAPLPVALKRLVRHVRDRDMHQASLLREGEVGLWLQHPNIVRTLDLLSFSTATETEYALVLEWIYGSTLAHLMRLKPFTPGMAAYVVFQVAQGLAHAVSTVGPSGKPMRAIHRDLKPSNLMLTRDGVVKIVDFGIARYDGRTQLTEGLVIKGTLEYASPEVLTGCTEELTPAADIYSLGLIFYRLLMGKPLLECDEPIQYYHRIPTLDVGPILNQLPVELSPLRPILLRMLQIVPEARYTDPWELAFVLKELLPSLPGGLTCERDLIDLCRQAPVQEPSRNHIELDRHAFAPPLIVPSAQLNAAQRRLEPVSHTVEKTIAMSVSQPVMPPPHRTSWELWVLLVLVSLNLGLMGLLWQSTSHKTSSTVPAQPPSTVPAGHERSGTTSSREPTETPVSPENRTALAPDPLKAALAPAARPFTSTARVVKASGRSQDSVPTGSSGSATATTVAERKPSPPRNEAPPAPIAVQSGNSTPTGPALDDAPQGHQSIPPSGPTGSTPIISDPVKDEAARQARAVLEARAPQIEKQEIYLTSIPVADIWLDGRQVASQRSVRVRVLTGEHQIRMRAPDGVEHRFTIQVEAGPMRTYRWLFEQEKLQIVISGAESNDRSSIRE